MAKQTDANSTHKSQPASQQIEEELARAALDKRRQGKQPTVREVAALKKVEQRQEEESRWRHYDSIPKKHYVEMSGRSHKVLNEQAVRYGIPLQGREVRLASLLTWLHDFLAKNSKQVFKGDDEDGILAGSSSPALERCREIRADLWQIELDEKKKRLIDIEEVQKVYALLLSRMRSAQQKLQDLPNGEDAARIVDDELLAFLETVVEQEQESNADICHSEP